jgi:hypothetical protein
MRRRAAFSSRNASGSSMTTAKTMLSHMPLVCRSNPVAGVCWITLVPNPRAAAMLLERGGLSGLRAFAQQCATNPGTSLIFLGD